MAKLLLLERLTDERSAYNSRSFANRRGSLASVKDGLVKPHPLMMSPYNAGNHKWFQASPILPTRTTRASG